MKKITPFWNYFQKNEQEIFNALLLLINYDEVFPQFLKKLSYVSKRIGFIIKVPDANQEKHTIIFTCGGYHKLFAKTIALAEQVPELELFTAQAFIKPFEDVSKYKNGTDDPIDFYDHEIKISELQMALIDYNIEKKELKINIYVPYYNELREYKNLKSEFIWIVMFIIGEIAYRKHIKEIRLHQMPLEPKGLLSLIELPDFIEYLYKINSRKKTREV